MEPLHTLTLKGLNEDDLETLKEFLDNEEFNYEITTD